MLIVSIGVACGILIAIDIAHTLDCLRSTSVARIAIVGACDTVLVGITSRVVVASALAYRIAHGIHTLALRETLGIDERMCTMFVR
jgi:hypothetical protein